MLNSPLVRKLVQLALEEDVLFGDVTAECTIPEGHRSRARIIARERLILCGGPLISVVAKEAGWDVAVVLKAKDGEELVDQQPIAELEGETRHLLSLERTILNFLQRLSGVATHTRKMVEEAGEVTILDTRKTMPGWRVLEKYAVRVGGAKNHRMHLGEMILVKNNHIDAHGGDVDSLFQQIKETKPWYTPVECEVRSLEELEKVLPYKPDFVLLDNMSDEMIEQALNRLLRLGDGAPRAEVSGNLTRERFKALDRIGVQCASMGGLTTKAVNVDISMRIAKE